MSYIHPNLPIATERIADFCERWKIVEFELFGSVLGDDFGPDSDVDVMVTFAAEAEWGMFDLVRMTEDLKAIMGRDVDLLTRRSVERSPNWMRRDAILNSARRVYAAH